MVKTMTSRNRVKTPGFLLQSSESLVKNKHLGTSLYIPYTNDAPPIKIKQTAPTIPHGAGVPRRLGHGKTRHGQKKLPKEGPQIPPVIGHDSRRGKKPAFWLFCDSVIQAESQLFF